MVWEPGSRLSVVDLVSEKNPADEGPDVPAPRRKLFVPEEPPPETLYEPRGKVARLWVCLKEAWCESIPTWFPLLSVLLALLAGIFLDQTQGILQALVDPADGRSITDPTLPSAQVRHVWFFVFTLCGWSVVNFLASSSLHQFDYNSAEYNGRLAERGRWTGAIFKWLEKWSPLVVGLGPVAAVETSLLVLRCRYAEAHEPQLQFSFLLFLPCLVVIFLMALRPLTAKPPQGREGRRKLQAVIPNWVKWLHWIFFALIAALVAFTARAPERWSVVGPAATLCIAATVFVIVGSLLVFWGGRWRVPLIFIFLVLSIAMSPFNDNHRVRITRAVPSATAEAPGEEMRIIDALGGWRKRLSLDEDPAPGQKTPLFIICAEGGGVRAAYWAARLLAYLEDTTRQHPQQYVPFSSRVLLISSVSGGSLGAATFSALLDRNPAPNAIPAKPNWFSEHSANFLARDHLSAPLASAAFIDTTQRFVPWPLFIERDRAAGLERAWENAWHLSLQSFQEDSTAFCGFDDDFRKLWRHRGRPTADVRDRWMPSLFFNGTSVELGGRIIVSDCMIQTGYYPGAQDALRLLKLRSLGPGKTEAPQPGLFRLSTAVNFSSRFPGISPSGEIPALTDERAQRVVDGGYYDNSGARTAWDNLVPVYYNLLDDVGQSGKAADIIPWVITIRAGPQTKRDTPSRRMLPPPSASTTAGEPSPWSRLWQRFGPDPQHFMVDIFAPPRAFFHAWESRSGDSAEALKDGTCLISRDLAGIGDDNNVKDCADPPVERVDYSPTFPQTQECKATRRDPFVIDLNLIIDERAKPEDRKHLVPLGWMLPRSAMLVMEEELEKRLAPSPALLAEGPKNRGDAWFKEMQKTQLGRVLALLHRERPRNLSKEALPACPSPTPSPPIAPPSPTPTATPLPPTPTSTPSPTPPNGGDTQTDNGQAISASGTEKSVPASPTPGPCGKIGPHVKTPICLPRRRAEVRRIR